MEQDDFDRLQRLSVELAGNNVLLPVAAALAGLPDAPATTPRVVEALDGRLPPNRVTEALQRLDRLGVVRELPYPGRPHPRLFERVQGPFWTFVRAWALDSAVDCAER